MKKVTEFLKKAMEWAKETAAWILIDERDGKPIPQSREEPRLTDVVSRAVSYRLTGAGFHLYVGNCVLNTWVGVDSILPTRDNLLCQLREVLSGDFTDKGKIYTEVSIALVPECDGYRIGNHYICEWNKVTIATSIATELHKAYKELKNEINK